MLFTQHLFFVVLLFFHGHEARAMEGNQSNQQPCNTHYQGFQEQAYNLAAMQQQCCVYPNGAVVFYYLPPLQGQSLREQDLNRLIECKYSKKHVNHTPYLLSCGHVYCVRDLLAWYVHYNQYTSSALDPHQQCRACHTPFDDEVIRYLEDQAKYRNQRDRVLYKRRQLIIVESCYWCKQVMLPNRFPFELRCGCCYCFECLLKWYAQHDDSKSSRVDNYQQCPKCHMPFNEYLKRQKFEQNKIYKTLRMNFLKKTCDSLAPCNDN